MMSEKESVGSLSASARARDARRIGRWPLLLRRSSSVSADTLYSKRQISHTLLPFLLPSSRRHVKDRNVHPPEDGDPLVALDLVVHEAVDLVVNSVVMEGGNREHVGAPS